MSVLTMSHMMLTMCPAVSTLIQKVFSNYMYHATEENELHIRDGPES